MAIITKRQAEIYKVEKLIKENLFKIDKSASSIEQIVYNKINAENLQVNTNLQNEDNQSSIYKNRKH